MIRRAAPLLLVLLFSVISGPPVHASGHGPVLKGQEVDRSVSLSGQTGACECLQQWYTLGLRPGAATISGRLKACGDRRQPYCFMVVSLLHGNSTVGTTSVQCPSKASHCNRAWAIHYRVKKQGVYYVQIRGEVGLIMNYTLHPAGHLYRLRCGKYCQE
jgi:hypothetical protein